VLQIESLSTAMNRVQEVLPANTADREWILHLKDPLKCFTEPTSGGKLALCLCWLKTGHEIVQTRRSYITGLLYSAMQLLNIEFTRGRAIATTPSVASRANKRSSSSRAGEGKAGSESKSNVRPDTSDGGQQLGAGQQEDMVGTESGRSATTIQSIHSVHSQPRSSSPQLGRAESNSGSGDEYQDDSSGRGGAGARIIDDDNGDNDDNDDDNDEEEPVTGRLVDQETRKIERQLQLQRAQQRRAKEARLQRAKVGRLHIVALCCACISRDSVGY
jgi:hypothetical protein